MYAPMVTLSIPFSPWTKGKHDYEVEEALAERQAARANLAAVKNMTLFEVTRSQQKLRQQRNLSRFGMDCCPRPNNRFKPPSLPIKRQREFHDPLWMPRERLEMSAWVTTRHG